MKVQIIKKVHNKIQTNKNIERVQYKQQNTNRQTMEKGAKYTTKIQTLKKKHTNFKMEFNL